MQESATWQLSTCIKLLVGYRQCLHVSSIPFCFMYHITLNPSFLLFFTVKSVFISAVIYFQNRFRYLSEDYNLRY